MVGIKLEDLPYGIKQNYCVEFPKKTFPIKRNGIRYLDAENGNVILGQGKSGRYKGYLVAIKCIPKSRFAPNILNKVFEHLTFLTAFSDYNVVKVYEVNQTDINFFLVMEHVDKKFTCADNTPEQISDFYEQIVGGLNFLHSKKIENRNITADHIFLDSSNNIKLAEFGLTAFMGKYFIQQQSDLEKRLLEILDIYQIPPNAKMLTINLPLTPSTPKSSPSSPNSPVSSVFNFFLRYSFKKRIGSGAFGEVMLADDLSLDRKVAVKIIKKKKSDETINREWMILKDLNQKNVIKLYEVFDTLDTLYLVMEYAPKGDLQNYLIKKGKLTEREAVIIFAHIVNGVIFLHSKNVAHRDLKLANILIDANGVFKVADFGIANVFTKGKMLDTVCGTLHYVPPEFFNFDSYDGTKFDVWSLGVIFYELLTSKLPFQNMVETIKIDYSTPICVSPQSKSIIRSIFVFSPSERPTAENIGYALLQILQDS